MAGKRGTLTNSADFATGTSKKTLLQLIAPSNQALRIEAFGIGFKGIVVTDPPVLVELILQSTAGTGTARAPVRRAPGPTATLQATGFENFTGEPTTDRTIWVNTIHPQASGEIPLLDRSIVIDATERLGVVVTTSVSVSGRAHIDFEE